MMRKTSIVKSFIQILIIVIMLALLSFSCKDAGVQPPDNIFDLTVDDVSCTEVYLQLKIGAGTTSRIVALKRDTITLFTKTINESETVITDTSLLPGHSYSYLAQLSNGLTAQAQASTLDTTSHNFTWQTFTLGDGNGSSMLYDVTIINDTLAYAVGGIWQRDTIFNVAKWDGTNWELKQLFYNSNVIISIRGILLFGINNIWFAAGSIFHWDGNSSQSQLVFSRLTLSDPNATIEKLLGTSSSLLYGVGNAGTIVFYNGSTWTKIESGTTLPFQDIYGSGNEVLAIASDKFGLGGKYLVHLSGNTASQVPTDIPTAVSFSSIWFESGRRYYLAGNGIYTKHSLSGSTWQMDPFTNELQTYEYAVRGTGPNDVVVVGEGGAIGHFNGKSWRSYSYAGRTAGDRLSSVCIKNNQIVAVGTRYIDGMHDQALICIGRR